jgi:hypothetical protein
MKFTNSDAVGLEQAAGKLGLGRGRFFVAGRDSFG